MPTARKLEAAHATASGNFGFPSWSPDGDADRLPLGLARSATACSSSTSPRATMKTLMDGKTHVNFPKWSPRGDRIAFTADFDGDYEIYTIRA